MIRYSCLQGSPAWLALHVGIPTASNADRLVTVKTHKPSAQAEKFAIELCTARLLGELPDAASTGWMNRGLELEAEARAYYSVARDVEIEQVGFITTDDGRIGCSPDFLVGDDGGGEIKCLSAVNHVAALLGATDDSHVLQVQWCLWVTERAWWDRVWFSPAIKPLILRVERDEETITQLAGAARELNERVDAMMAKLLAMGCKPRIPASGDLSGQQTDDQRFDAAWAADADPGASKAVRAAELAAAIRMMPDNEDRASLYFRYMLSADQDLERSIAGLSDGMLEELNADIGMARSGI